MILSKKDYPDNIGGYYPISLKILIEKIGVSLRKKKFCLGTAASAPAGGFLVYQLDKQTSDSRLAQPDPTLGGAIS